jgi:hypothetical protein
MLFVSVRNRQSLGRKREAALMVEFLSKSEEEKPKVKTLSVELCTEALS